MDINSLLNPKRGDGPVRSQPTRSNPASAYASPHPSDSSSHLSISPPPRPSRPSNIGRPLYRPPLHEFTPREASPNFVPQKRHRPASPSSHSAPTTNNPSQSHSHKIPRTQNLVPAKEHTNAPSLDEIRRTVAQIEEHLGFTHLAKGWARSIETAIEHFWSSSELHSAQVTIGRRLRKAEDWLNLARSRWSDVVASADFFCFSGLVPPREVLLDGFDDPDSRSDSWFRSQVAGYYGVLAANLDNFRTGEAWRGGDRLRAQIKASMDSIEKTLRGNTGGALERALSTLWTRIEASDKWRSRGKFDSDRLQREAKILLIMRESLNILVRNNNRYPPLWSVDLPPEKYRYLFIPTPEEFYDPVKIMGNSEANFTLSADNKFRPKKRQSRDPESSQSKLFRAKHSTKNDQAPSGSNSLSHPVSTLSARLHRLYFD